jgi:aminoglycoside N3'-acetyltransferase
MEAARLGDVTSQLVALGTRRGSVLLVHTSYRAVGPIEGGPRGLGASSAWRGGSERRGLQREGPVGHGRAKLADARDAVAVGELRRDPLVFLCPTGEGCEECDEARASVRF